MLIIHILYSITFVSAVSARPAKPAIFKNFSSAPFVSPLRVLSTRSTFLIGDQAEIQDDPVNPDNESYPDIPIFDPSFPQKEIRNVAAKYSTAHKYLQAQDLSIPINFTELNYELQGHDPTAQVAGSTYVLDLQSYGNDLSYFGNVALGSPSQSLLFDVDTGSADLWVPSNCLGCNPSMMQFDSGASSTYEETDQPFKVTYGTGDVEGKIALETVAIGPLSVQEHYFGSVSKESDDFAGVPFNGIIGMAFSSVSATGKPTFMERLIQENQLNAAVFGVHLTRHEPRNSEVCIGCYDTEKYTGDISWHRVISKSYWCIALTNIRVNGINTAPRQVIAAIDTGTSLNYFPLDLADAFYRQIPGSKHASQYAPGLYTYPCEVQPIVSLTFGVNTYEINLRDFNLGRTSSSGHDCVGGIIAMGNDFPTDLAIIGAEFLKSWYSVYDYDHGTRVGFAKSINNSDR